MFIQLQQKASGGTAETSSIPWPMAIFLTIPAIGIILMTIFGNMLVLRFKAKVGLTNTTLLVWNLGLTDFLVGVFVLPLGAIHLIYGEWIFGRTLCRIWVGADVTFCTASVVTICIISVDRYLAVTRPLRYKMVVTKFKVTLIIAFIWAFSSGILFATVRWDDNRIEDQTIDKNTCFAGNEIRYLAHSVVFAFFLPASVTLTLYWRIYRLARNRQKALDRGFLMILGHNMNFLTNTLSQATALRVHIGKNNGLVEHQRRVLRTHERIAKTLGVVSCSFLFCWLPFFTLYLTNYKCNGCIPTFIIDMASWLGYCNSMINPIIYSFTVREFKRSAAQTVRPFWSCLHGQCPRWVAKPPENRNTRMERGQQQVGIKSKTPAAKHEMYRLPGYMAQQKTHPKSATAMLMRGINASIPQSPLGIERQRMEQILVVDDKYRSLNPQKEKSPAADGEERKRSFLGSKGNGFLKSSPKKADHSPDEEIEMEGLTKEDGVVTTTLLLVTTGNIYGSKQSLSNIEENSGSNNNNNNKDRRMDGGIEKDEGSSVSSSSSLTSMRPIRMPYKPKLKRLKSHSLPTSSLATMPIPAYNSPIQQQQQPSSSLLQANLPKGRWKLSSNSKQCSRSSVEKRRGSMLQSILEIKDWSPLPALHDILRPRSSSAVVETRPSEAAKAQQQQKKKSSVSSVKPKKEVATDEGKSGNDDAKTEENLSPEMPLISVKINHDYSARLIFNTNDEVEV